MKYEETNHENLGYKFKAISLLHMLGYNSDVPASEIGAEILYAVGNILEGSKVEDLELRVIDKEALLREMTYG